MSCNHLYYPENCVNGCHDFGISATESPRRSGFDRMVDGIEDVANKVPPAIREDGTDLIDDWLAVAMDYWRRRPGLDPEVAA